jgi:anti-sigma B factor antagonist
MRVKVKAEMPVAQRRQILADVAVIVSEGEMGECELSVLGEELFRLAHLGRRRVILDLTRVVHVDYRGLRALAARARLLRAGGGDLKICGLSSYLRAIFRVAGVEMDFDIHADAASAHGAFDPVGSAPAA